MKMTNNRATIKKSFELNGVGLHSGKKVNVCIRPSTNKGIFFKRVDVPKSDFIEVDVKNIINTHYSIDLSKNGTKVKTVEHVLASLYGTGVDDCIVELDNEEFPILDGSGDIITKNILGCGLKKNKSLKKIVSFNKPFAVSTNGSCILAVPDKNLKISIVVSYENKFIGTQYKEIGVNRETFIKEIAGAKTFGWLNEIEKERKQGLIKGGSFNNALVYNDKGLINKKNQRFKDEPVRHKILDLIGALAFLPYKINAHVVGIKTGHTIDIEFVKKILSIT